MDNTETARASERLTVCNLLQYIQYLSTRDFTENKKETVVSLDSVSDSRLQKTWSVPTLRLKNAGRWQIVSWGLFSLAGDSHEDKSQF